VEKNWIRRDRGTGEEEEVSAAFVQIKLISYYVDTEFAMLLASKDSPLTTGFADYWPKER
jgi:hypothetical protein